MCAPSPSSSRATRARPDGSPRSAAGAPPTSATRRSRRTAPRSCGARTRASSGPTAATTRRATGSSTSSAARVRCETIARMGETFLDALTEEEAADLHAAGRRRTYGPGVTLFHEGDDTGPVVVILAGRVKVATAGV